MKRLVIFDLDGTLANNDHRQKFLITQPKDWDSFFSHQAFDVVNKALADVCCALFESENFTVFIVSARPDRYRTETEDWLARNGIRFERLIMRKNGDRRADAVVKREILQDIRDDGFSPSIAVDDRSSVVEMWREEGLVCLQCENHSY
jgi:predicted secreted acid phosphatase